MASTQHDFSGLKWVDTLFSAEPKWTAEPEMGAIEALLRTIEPAETPEISFLTQGAFNKLYDVQLGDKALVLRVSLPVDPYHKTASEVATIEWIRRTTNLQVPTVITSDTSRNNPVGFEWMLMMKLPGAPLADSLKKLPTPKKSAIIRELAKFSATLFRNQLIGIGNIYLQEVLKTSIPNVGRIVSMHFFWKDHIHQDVDRGPFRTSVDWINARLVLSEQDCNSILARYPDGPSDSDDEDEIEDATRTLDIIQKLKPLVPMILSVDEHPEPSMLLHDDLSQHNILVNGEGGLSGVLDWECVSALPLWKACIFPSFLDEKSRESEPDIQRYLHNSDGEPNELYWEHLWEYQATVLRGEFIDAVRELEPKWVEVFDASQAQRDLDVAVLNCDSEIYARHIYAWIEDMCSGSRVVKSLTERLDNPELPQI